MASAFRIVLLLIFLNLSYFCPSQAAKIVGLPMMGGSQYMGMRNIGLELAKRGHNVTLLVSSAQKIKQSHIIHHAIFKVPYEPGMMEEFVSHVINHGIFKTLFFANMTMPKLLYTFCEHLLNEKELLGDLKDYDLLITDSSMPCGHVLSDFLDIKKIEYCPSSSRMTAPLHAFRENLFTSSFIPHALSGNTGNMSFFHRLKNTVLFCISSIAGPFALFRPFQQLKVKYNIKPEKSMVESIQDTELVLFLSDFALEYTYSMPPHYKSIGPVNIQPVQPLPPDLQHLIDSSGQEGAIIVSFGSNVATLSKVKIDAMAEAFGRLKQKVIWRLKGYIPPSLSSNIKPVSWLPQSDLLSHDKLRLFVSHAGQNSLYEAAYHGVPLVVIPLFGDQFDNGLLAEFRGFGLSLDLQTITADLLYITIQRVLREPSFRENAQRISRLMKDRPRSPVQEAGDWIEYALRHDSLAHLRPYSSQLAWYQYFLVDVALFLVLVLVLVMMVIKYTFRFVCWLCCRRNNKLKTQ